jgi:hypothetical protein
MDSGIKANNDARNTVCETCDLGTKYRSKDL